MKGLIARFLLPFLIKQLFDPKNVRFTCGVIKKFFQDTKNKFDDSLIPIIDQLEDKLTD